MRGTKAKQARKIAKAAAPNLPWVQYLEHKTLKPMRYLDAEFKPQIRMMELVRLQLGNCQRRIYQQLKATMR